ncbi:MAG: hypothetical protein ACP5GN_07290 [Fervidicoccaceae archaeon]
MIDVWALISWGMWIAFSIASGSLIYGAISRIFGRREGGRYLAGGMVALLVIAFGWGLVQALYEGASPPLPYGWVFYAVAGVLLIGSAVYLAMGKSSEGAWSLLGALLIVGIGMFASSIASGVSFQGVGNIDVNLYLDSLYLHSGETLNLTIIPQGGSPPYSTSVDWGDGSIPTATNIYNSVTLQHTYVLGENQSGNGFTIVVSARDSSGKQGVNAVGISVVNADYCPLSWPFDIFCGLVKKVSVILPAIDLQKLVASPLMPRGGELWDLYQQILKLSMSAFGLFLAFRIAWDFIEEGSIAETFISIFKDAVVVIALALLIPYIYNATAQILNTVSYSLISRIDISWVMGWIMLEVALGVALGYFVPFVAEYAAMLVFVLLIASMFIYVRYFLILSLVVASPLLSIAYLHPGLRSAVRTATSLIGGLMLSGPMAAVFLLVMEELMPGKSMTFGILYPVIVGTLPNILGIFGSGIAGSVTRSLRSHMRILYYPVKAIGSSKLRESSFSKEEQPYVAVQRTGYARLRIPHSSAQKPTFTMKAAERELKPIVTGEVIGRAYREAKGTKEVMEGLAELQERSLGIVGVLEGFERAKEVERMLARERIDPKLEAFKSFTMSLGKHAVKQGATNLRSLAEHTREALKKRIESEIEYGARMFREAPRELPERVKRNLEDVERRSVKLNRHR